MQITPSYSNKDIVSLREDVINQIRSKTSKWTDFNESDLGMVLVEVALGCIDYGNFYLDHQALETFIGTARQRKNVKALAEAMGVKLDNLGSARGEVLVRNVKIDSGTEQAEGYKFTIPRHSRLTVIRDRNTPPLTYVTVRETKFDSSDLEKKVEIVQGIPSTKMLSKEDVSLSFKYYLPVKNVPVDSVYIEQDGVEWEKVNDAFVEYEGGPKYSVHSTAESEILIVFTYNFREFLPVDDQIPMEIHYLISEGSKGNLPSNTNISFVGPITDDLSGENITNKLDVSNPSAFSFGYDEMSINRIKAAAKLNVSTMDRLVVVKDFEAYLSKLGYVEKYKVEDWHTDPSLVSQPYNVFVWIATKENAIDIQPQLDLLKEELSAISIPKVDVVVAEYLPLSWNIDVVSTGDLNFREGLSERIYQAVMDRMSIENVDFGDRIDSEIIKSLVYRVSNSIKKVEVAGGTSEEIRSTQFPVAGSVSVEVRTEYE